jgi:hypothetical protein
VIFLLSKVDAPHPGLVDELNTISISLLLAPALAINYLELQKVRINGLAYVIDYQGQVKYFSM